MSARAAARQSEAVGIHAVLSRVVPNEPHGPMDVRLNLRHDELRLGAMNNREDGVAARHQRLERLRVDGFMCGEPSAADQRNDANPVRLGRLDRKSTRLNSSHLGISY